MSRSPWIIFLVLASLIVAMSPAASLSLPSSMVGHFVPVGSLEGRPTSFSPLLIRQTAVRSTWDMENASFLRARYALANASSHEVSSYREQLGLQRSNLLRAHLNGVLLDAQKSDFLVGAFPSMLIRLRLVYYHARDRGMVIDSFEDRYASLRDAIPALESSQSDLRNELLHISKTNSESREAIESAQLKTSRHLSALTAWIARYRVLLREVLLLE